MKMKDLQRMETSNYTTILVNGNTPRKSNAFFSCLVLFPLESALDVFIADRNIDNTIKTENVIPL